jgi:hypothetical protein
MKKIYAFITGALMLGATVATQAQSPRTVLMEEFTGENCGPCAGFNPYLKRYMDLVSTDSFIHIAYQVPIPSAGPIYNAYKTDANARIGYYGINIAPSGKVDGATFLYSDYDATYPINAYNFLDTASVSSYNADPATTTPTSQTFNDRRAITSPCTISITHSYSAGYDSVFATAIIHTTQDFYSSAAGKLKFRMALIENQLSYGSAPGSNGETEFHQVVRKLLPSAAGTNMADTLLNGRVDTLKFALKIPTYVRERAQLRFVGWIQDDGNKGVKQAGISKLVATPGLLDFVAFSDSVQALLCSNGGSTPAYAQVTVKNTGTVALTSLTIQVKVDGSLVSTIPWTGNIASGSSTDVPVGPLSISGDGYHSVQTILTQPNGLSGYSYVLYDTTKSYPFLAGASAASPYAESFEDTSSFPPANQYTDAETPLASTWYPSFAFQSPSSNYYGAEATTHSIFYYFYSVDPGEIGNYYLQKVNLTSSPKARMTFWHAARAYGNTNQTTNDQVEVQASIDCGANWSTLWSKSGAALATVPAAMSNSSFKPTNAGQWKADTISLNSVAGNDNVWIRFRATSDYGDNAFIDQINIETLTTGINNIESVEMASVYPNPANDRTAIELGLTANTPVGIDLYNALGQHVSTVLNNTNLSQGLHKFEVSTSDLSAGIYTLEIKSDDNKISRKFVVAH